MNAPTMKRGEFSGLGFEIIDDYDNVVRHHKEDLLERRLKKLKAILGRPKPSKYKCEIVMWLAIRERLTALEPSEAKRFDDFLRECVESDNNYASAMIKMTLYGFDIEISETEFYWLMRLKDTDDFTEDFHDWYTFEDWKYGYPLPMPKYTNWKDGHEHIEWIDCYCDTWFICLGELEEYMTEENKQLILPFLELLKRRR